MSTNQPIVSNSSNNEIGDDSCEDDSCEWYDVNDANDANDVNNVNVANDANDVEIGIQNGDGDADSVEIYNALTRGMMQSVAHFSSIELQKEQFPELLHVEKKYLESKCTSEFTQNMPAIETQPFNEEWTHDHGPTGKVLNAITKSDVF